MSCMYICMYVRVHGETALRYCFFRPLLGLGIWNLFRIQTPLCYTFSVTEVQPDTALVEVVFSKHSNVFRPNGELKHCFDSNRPNWRSTQRLNIIYCSFSYIT